MNAVKSSRWMIGFIALALLPAAAEARVFVQCPGDTNGDGVIDTPDPAHPNAVCMHLTGGDGFVRMADGKSTYIFGYSDVTGIPEAQVGQAALLAANFPAPTIKVKEGQELYLTLTNIGMAMRPDLFDAHSVHFHGFHNAASVFDGVPDASLAINMGASLTYYYKITEPGTYIYHCHVEATEHMQMGMLGNLYVLAGQNDLPDGTPLAKGFVHRTGNKYAYDDGDGSTRYDVEYPLQISGFDSAFHDASIAVQPVPFAALHENYPMLNGRGYPDTVNKNPIANVNGRNAQTMHSLVEATRGQRILLRISNVSITSFNTLATTGLPLRVVGSGAHILRGPDPDGSGPALGTNLYYETSSLTLGGGETVDAIIDTAAVPAGTYFIYTPNLYNLSNDREDFGGLLTEIRIN